MATRRRTRHTPREETTRSLKRSRIEAAPEVAAAKPKRVQTAKEQTHETLRAQMIQSVAQNWEATEAEKIKRVARTLGSDDRYMRRKKREYIHAVLTAHTGLQPTTKQQQQERKRKHEQVVQTEKQSEESEEEEEEEEEAEEKEEENDEEEEEESDHSSPMKPKSPVSQDETSEIQDEDMSEEREDVAEKEEKEELLVEPLSQGDAVQEQELKEEQHVFNGEKSSTYPDAVSAPKTSVLEGTDTGVEGKQEEKQVAEPQVAEDMEQEEKQVAELESEPSAQLEDNTVLPAPMSPDRTSAHSPVERIAQAKTKASAIDPTPEKSAPPVAVASKPKRIVARGIAQSSSSASTRKRMISFSPERAPRPENRALALKKLEKNLKTNEKLQQRLKAPTPVKAPAPSRMSSPAAATPVRRPINFTSPQVRRPITFQSPQTRRHMAFTSPPPRRPVYESPYTGASCSFPLSQTEELQYDSPAEDHDEDKDVSLAEVVLSNDDFKPSVVVAEEIVAANGGVDVNNAEEDGGVIMHSQDEVGLSQESVSLAHSHADNLAPLSQESCNSMTAEAEPVTAHADTASNAFTSTSVIGDVGLFNCDTDVEYTGGVYGEGTDGKVTAAVINGQKVALKRAKPHEGFPEQEAKHRAALELHYLRRVRHMKGFLQCLGLCDAIEHTCIALEVMDCKLSDYLRRYGVNSGGSKHRRYTLSFADTKAMLKQICLPMITLHEDINVAHGDLACRNILMRTPPEGYEQSWEPDIKLSDFGRIKLPSEEPKILDSSFSFHKNCDVGAFGREILYRLLVGEIVPKEFVETRSLHKLLQDVTVTLVPEAAKTRLGPYYNLFMRCTAWGVRPTFREIYEHLDDLQHFETTENGLFPLKPTGASDATFMSPVADGTSRHKTPTSSASRALKRDTPTGRRPSGPKSRLFTSKNVNEASIPGPNKPVNWLKTRSIGVQRPVAQQSLTPTAHPLLIKKKRKTPPSAGAGAGASRRSLQILNQIQHRTSEKGRKST
ncbi:hypothetical protein PR003_g20443 [Phytophthora rubi]|uniref:Protein kinase domain-containing protein n=1 Tax=Phytophthora rubi TaxID=129364 RepID=A0A6A3JLX6_9STRA|nr:hypothetical protein PR002_g19883 [Phytophthora rubi]KAE8998283.1 hypothetical protein PR001_g19368 [Phytophthora rubi]KAE9309753.1 hypothetical protein PR003_g20443 [Phytophthora rubi]